LFGGGADVATFGIKHDGYVRILRFQIIANRLQLILCRNGSEIRNLRLERAGGRCSGINDRLAKSEDGIALSLQSIRKTLDIGIKADAKQRVISSDGGSKFVSEFHASW